MTRSAVLERLSRAYVVDDSGCWLWTRSVQTAGYGQILVEGRRWLAHRLIYTLLVGEIPEGMVVDHVCRTRRCVNPAHLQVVTVKQNCEHRAGSTSSESGVRGVTRDKRTGRWLAQVKHNRVSHFVGRFDRLEDAALAVSSKRRELFTNSLADKAA